MRAALGYAIGAAVSLTGGIADLAYINVRLVPRMMHKATPDAEAMEAPLPPKPVEAEPPVAEAPIVEEEPPAPQEIEWELAAVVHFRTSSDELGRKARAEIRRVAERMLDDPSLLARTDGHADERGPSPYNEELSDRRALAVVRELERLGVRGDRIERRAFGERMASDRWMLDRRVEISIKKSGIGGPRK